MTSTTTSPTRRTLLKGTGAAALLTLGSPAIVRAQASGDIHLGTLTPLTGAGGPYGPLMAEAARLVVDEVNEAGGILGRRIRLFSEDDQTNPEAGVRAARKLIDVDEVSAIMGTWASSVTTAVAPLCWESGTFLITESGSDTITELPHRGYLVRTQPNTTLQGQKFGEYAVELGAESVYFMTPQTPFADSQFASMKVAVEGAGGTIERLVYDDKKTSMRSEIDMVMRAGPDAIVLGGYTPDTTVVLKDLFRAGWEGITLGFAYSINQALLDAMPDEAVEGVYTLSPSPSEGSAAYEKLVALTGTENPDTYTCQVFDHTNLVLLAIAAAGEASGTAIKENIRKVSQGGGREVTYVLDGLKALEAGEEIDYSGASGPCDFTERGDITDSKFRYDRIEGGEIKMLRIA